MSWWQDVLGYYYRDDFPKWKTVERYFRQWRIDGAWERIYEQLRLRDTCHRVPSSSVHQQPFSTVNQ